MKKKINKPTHLFLLKNGLDKNFLTLFEKKKKAFSGQVLTQRRTIFCTFRTVFDCT